MLDPATLYEIEPASEDSGPEMTDPVLIVALDGFVDAGAATRLGVTALTVGAEPRVVARFDVDQLIDYRSRRPPLRFETDRWSDYTAPELNVVAMADTAGSPYLLLAGPEPDMQWERFSAAVEQLVRHFGVRLVVNLSAIPLAVPHTRPIGVTVHGTRPELTEGHQAWFASAEVPGSAVGLMEYRLGQAGVDVLGFAVHVPHYLARAEYPQAARVLIDHVGLASELYLSTESLSTAAERADQEIAEQVEASDEVRQIVSALEKQYDTVSSGRGDRGGLSLGGDIPSADELAAEVERFLADQEADGPDADGPAADGPDTDGPGTGSGPATS